MVLICYDGSADAKSAIDQAGRLFTGQTARVLTVWEPFEQVLMRSPGGLGPMAGLSDVERIDASRAKDAEAVAAEGAERASAMELSADSCARRQEGSVAHTILAEAKDSGARAIVMGTRGRTGLKSLLLGSVSHSVVQHADRAVVVVPGEDVASSRAAALRHVRDNV